MSPCAQNVVAQNNLGGGSGEFRDRWLIHGLHRAFSSVARCIDERAVMQDQTLGAEYYYVPGLNWHVEALVNNRGHEVEHHSYDAYMQSVVTADREVLTLSSHPESNLF